MGPSRRSPGTPRPPGASKGGRPLPQQGGRAGVGRVARHWEDSSGEQPRGGAGGRGRRGRGRGSPHLSGAGDASTADRKSKVGPGMGWRPLADALPVSFASFLPANGPAFCICLLPPLRRLVLSLLPPPLLTASSPCVFISPCFALCLVHPCHPPCLAPSLSSLWLLLSSARALLGSLFLSVSLPGSVRGEQ